VTARVWPTDADLSVVNNASYLVFFEMGRIDLQLRTGLIRLAAERGWSALTASLDVQFRKPLRRFQKFRVNTRLLGWDDRWLYVEQQIVRNRETVATALSKSLLIGSEGRISPASLATAMGMPATSPGMPVHVATYREAEKLERAHHESAWTLGASGDP